jgi:hypothetical protein
MVRAADSAVAAKFGTIYLHIPDHFHVRDE